MSTPSTDPDTRPGSLRQRARAPSPAELAMIPWLGLLDADERRRVVEALRVVEADPGDYVCKIGRQANYWFGVLDGLLKMSNDASLGFAITFTGVPPGAWFGEGTVLKREVYRYNIEPLRKSVVAGIDIDTFFWLLERSIPFNRYVMNQLNERLGQFIAAREIDRLDDPDTRVARNLAALFHPVLYPGVGTLLRITQQELAYLIGLSRQRVNEALRSLQAEGLIAIEYGGVRVLDLPALRRHVHGGSGSTMS
ncbi:Crp/Fnr family transcriptional regulator [Variovorax sp. YR752]|uniref:Crp/Fnr family transcriptional regulator n=1 Tax=Variovorax sp. YR752 TaxID=1884383 RepID=UPI00313780ED